MNHADVWSSYSPREAAQLLGLPESAVRTLARAGVIGDRAVPVRLGFRDLAALRTVKALVAAGLPLARVRREIIALCAARPGVVLAELALEVDRGHVRVRGEAAEAPTTQLPL
ncbi:MAG: MerR family transcriptional regulator, partial [Myxococcales bacterium]|nr:MerR family transcriptional regulator [Myxococcales bacterium]